MEIKTKYNIGQTLYEFNGNRVISRTINCIDIRINDAEQKEEYFDERGNVINVTFYQASLAEVREKIQQEYDKKLAIVDEQIKKG